MEVKAVCILCVLVCAVLTSCAMSMSPRTYDMDAVAEIAPAYEKAVDSVRERLDDDESGYDTGVKDVEKALSRRRRMIGGMPRKVGSTYRGRPRPAVYRPRWRPGKSRARQNVSPY